MGRREKEKKGKKRRTDTYNVGQHGPSIIPWKGNVDFC